MGTLGWDRATGVNPEREISGEAMLEAESDGLDVWQVSAALDSAGRLTSMGCHQNALDRA